MALKKHIVLTGFMGTGKTSVGRILSRRLGVKMVDTDEEIVKKVGKTIPEIFAMPEGEEGFRNIESEVIKEVVSIRPYLVISAGGGAILRRENVDELKRNGIIINLRASSTAICERIGKGGERDARPLLTSYFKHGKNKELLNRIEELLKLRASKYADCDFFIDTDDITPDEAADKIIKQIEDIIIP